MVYFTKSGTPANPLQDMVKEAIDIQKQIDELKKKYEEKKLKILEICQKNEVDEFDVDNVHVNYVKETFRKSFDSKLFKLEHPDMYNKYIKETIVKASIRFKIKKDD